MVIHQTMESLIKVELAGNQSKLLKISIYFNNVNKQKICIQNVMTDYQPT